MIGRASQPAGVLSRLNGLTASGLRMSYFTAAGINVIQIRQFSQINSAHFGKRWRLTDEA